MTLVTFVVTLLVLGIIAYLIDRFVPLPEIIRTVLGIVLVVVVILMLLALFNIMQLPFAIK